ncbi:MAG: hypothetical protein WCE80_08480, partial [Acidimicrobiia bacterium]
TVTIDHGRLVETRPPGALPRLRPHAGPVTVGPVAPSVELAEEAAIIWRWLKSQPLKMIECTGIFAYPTPRIERLTPRAA